MNWTNNIYNTGIISKIVNHFRADCVTVNSYTNQIVPTVYNCKNTTATQTTSTKQPLHVTQPYLNRSNKDYITFDGIDDTLVFSENITNSFDLWFVSKGLPTTNQNIKPLFTKGTGISTNRDISINFGGGGITPFYYDSNNIVHSLGGDQYISTYCRH